MKILGITVLVIIIGFFAWYLLDNLNTPSQNALSPQKKLSSLTKLLKRDPNLEIKKIPTDWITYNGDSIHFLYPNGGNIAKVATTSAQIVENFHESINNPLATITVQVVKMPDIQNLHEYPAVTLRENQRDIYKTSTIMKQNSKGISFTKSADGAEKTCFFYKKGLVYSIAVSGVSLQDIEPLYNRLISSISF